MIKVSTIHAYKFQGWSFEYYKNKPFSPWPLTKELEPRSRAGRQFYKMLADFEKLTITEKEQCRIL